MNDYDGFDIKLPDRTIHIRKETDIGGTEAYIKQYCKKMTKELNTLWECAISLNILPGVFSLKGHTKEVISSRKLIVPESKLVF